MKQWGALLAIQKGNTTKLPLLKIRSPHTKDSHTIKKIIEKPERQSYKVNITHHVLDSRPLKSA